MQVTAAPTAGGGGRLLRWRAAAVIRALDEREASPACLCCGDRADTGGAAVLAAGGERP